MAGRIWDQYLSEQDKLVLQGSGYGRQVGFGERPALMIIDVSYNFLGDKPLPILDSIKGWRNSCGEYGWRAVPIIRKLIDACRSRCPIVYTTNIRGPDGFEAGSWRWKNARELEDTEQEIRGNEVLAEIAPLTGDIVIKKTKPSAFFGTPLLSFLIDLQVDSLVIAGVSTSGCVRASVVDAFSNNFKCCIVEDACFDRTQVSHAINLFDLNAKYSDVRPSEEAIAFIRGLPARTNRISELERVGAGVKRR